jgi:succinate dehydrogenase / fumarate reductase flavoprotein subunit
VQGSNRLSSNSLSEVNVFGRIAGRHAAAHARDTAWAGWPQLEQRAAAALRLDASAASMGTDLDAMHDRLKRIMFAHAGIVRDAASMQAGLAAIAGLRAGLAAKGSPKVSDLGRYYEVCNMLDVGEAVTRSALHREESRGAHFRLDHPERNDARWRVVTRVQQASDGLRVSERPVEGSA